MTRPPLLLAALLLAAAAPTAGGAAAQGEAQMQVEALNAELLGHDSATLTLERWCADHALASPARIVAERVKGPDKPLPAAERERLGLAPSEPVRYRRVRLRCGEHVLSEADNWYRPGKLTPEMNRTLDETDAPFGKVVQPLGFHRRTLSAEVLWRPSDAGPAPEHVIRHRAVLELQDGTPFSEVVETYTREVVAPPP